MEKVQNVKLSWFKHIEEELDNMVKDNHKYGRVIVHVGSIDCQQNADPDDISSKYQTMFQKACSISESKTTASYQNQMKRYPNRYLYVV